jgi:ferric-dicitrate binding protein FerR (iron transport regulator)
MDDPTPRTPRRRRWIKVILGLLGGGALALALVWFFLPTPAAPLVDITSIEDLRTRFNEDRGRARIVLLVSPT